jgi:hypothetical protein
MPDTVVVKIQDTASLYNVQYVVYVLKLVVTESSREWRSPRDTTPLWYGYYSGGGRGYEHLKTTTSIQ